MNFKTFTIIFLSALLTVLVSSPLQARSAIYDTLAKGSHWSLNVDGESGPLELLGGKGSRTPDGGWKMTMDVKWQGIPGTLRGHADGKNSEQRVILQLTRKNGLKVACEGYIARETDTFMAGITVIPAKPKPSHGAWFAQKILTPEKLRKEELDTGRRTRLAIPPIPARNVSAANLSSISGKATGPRADAAKVFFILLYGPDDEKALKAKGRFDELGNYSFTGLPRGKYKLVLDTRADIAVGPEPYFRYVKCSGTEVKNINFEFK